LFEPVLVVAYLTNQCPEVIGKAGTKKLLKIYAAPSNISNSIAHPFYQLPFLSSVSLVFLLALGDSWYKND
jgi:hypothetical protein